MKHDFALKVTHKNGAVFMATANMEGVINAIWPDEEDHTGFAAHIHGYLANQPKMQIIMHGVEYIITHNPLES